MAKITENDHNVINLIGSGTEITCDVNCSGDVRIDGTLNGNLRTKGKVVIGETGNAKGEVSCKNADISGKMEGRIIVSELLSLKPSSIISGDIVTIRLAIEPGAKFTGNCKMNDTDQQSASETKNIPGQEKK
jgi:cytoskeletal protein CcmA (bactofilin family)